MKASISTRARITVAVIFVLTLCAITLAFLASWSRPVTATLVDSETGRPVSGAVIVAVWPLLKASLHGRRFGSHLEVMETVSGADGRLSFPGFFRAKLSSEMLEFDAPHIYVFATGYEVLKVVRVPLSGFADASLGLPQNVSIQDGLFKVRKARNPVNSTRYLQMLSAYKPEIDEATTQCGWRKTPKLIEWLRQAQAEFAKNGIDRLAYDVSAFTYPSLEKRCSAV